MWAHHDEDAIQSYDALINVVFIHFTSPKAHTVNDQYAHMCLTGDAHVTIIQDEDYWKYWIEIELITGIAWTVSEIIEHFLFSWLIPAWPWMKVKVNIMYMQCIHLTEAVTVSNLISIASLASEVWLAMDRHTHTDDTASCIFKVRRTLKTKITLKTEPAHMPAGALHWKSLQSCQSSQCHQSLQSNLSHCNAITVSVITRLTEPLQCHQ